MSVIKQVIDLVQESPLGITLGAGNYPHATAVSGKVIFAGGLGMSEENRPRNIMGGDILATQLVKVVMRGADYLQLEAGLDQISGILRQSGFSQISGFEHLDEQTVDNENLLQLAVAFRITK